MLSSFHMLAFLALKKCPFVCRPSASVCLSEPAYVEKLLQRRNGVYMVASFVYFGQTQRSISALLPVIKGADDVEQVHGPCPIRPHFTHDPSSQL